MRNAGEGFDIDVRVAVDTRNRRLLLLACDDERAGLSARL
jgi:hypothetical protein